MAPRGCRPPSRREVALAIPWLVSLGLREPDTGERGPGTPRGAGRSSTAILVRHAEKSAASDPEHPGDPSLSEAGNERAEALRRLLARAGVTHAFASEFRRTRETLAPLAADRSIQIEVVPAARLTELARRLRELPPGSLPVVAGHSNTVPAIARTLGVALPDLVESAGGPMLRDEEYARLFVVSYAVAPPPTDAEADRDDVSSQASALELAYGA